MGLSRQEKENIKQDVRAIENAKSEDTAKDAALLLRNDIFKAGQYDKAARRQALDLVERTNIYDRAENPNLPKITLLSHDTYPEIKACTKMQYKDKKVLEGTCPESEVPKENKPQQRQQKQSDVPPPPPAIVSERDR